MKNLVTVFGASGLVGRHTVRTLAGAGWRIRAVCRHPNLANYLLPAGVPLGVWISAMSWGSSSNTMCSAR